MSEPRWIPPPPPASPALDRVRGALAGSLLYARPEHRAVVDAVAAFLDGPAPAGLEIGFDHGISILDRARRHPAIRHLGVELRRRRVAAAAPHAPPNGLLLHGDARAVLAGLVPPERLDHVIVLFPTPTAHPRHLLFSPALVALLGRALRPGGVVHVATDVDGYAGWLDTLFVEWGAGPPPPLGEALSRRERVCRRDGVVVHTRTFARP